MRQSHRGTVGGLGLAAIVHNLRAKSEKLLRVGAPSIIDVTHACSPPTYSPPSRTDGADRRSSRMAFTIDALKSRKQCKSSLTGDGPCTTQRLSSASTGNE